MFVDRVSLGMSPKEEQKMQRLFGPHDLNFSRQSVALRFNITVPEKNQHPHTEEWRTRIGEQEKRGKGENEEKRRKQKKKQENIFGKKRKETGSGLKGGGEGWRATIPREDTRERNKERNFREKEKSKILGGPAEGGRGKGKSGGGRSQGAHHRERHTYRHTHTHRHIHRHTHRHIHRDTHNIGLNRIGQSRIGLSRTLAKVDLAQVGLASAEHPHGKPSIVAFKTATLLASPIVGMVLLKSRVGEHATNGVAESAMREVTRQTRTLKLALEAHVGRTMSPIPF